MKNPLTTVFGILAAIFPVIGSQLGGSFIPVGDALGKLSLAIMGFFAADR